MTEKRRPLVAANWKMHKTPEESLRFWEKFAARLTVETEWTDVVICPPYLSLPALQAANLRARGVHLGAQNVHEAPQGAFTGEISVTMLQAVGVSFVIVGHSERRAYFAESDEVIARKVRAVLGAGMTPILCVGESLEEREAGRAEAVVTSQLLAGLAGVDSAGASRVVVAYEPVWAIGTGRSAGAQDAGEMAAAVRRQLAGRFGDAVAERVRILYGGSVKPDNFEAFLAQPGVDGALVGTASLDPDAFFALVEIAARVASGAGAVPGAGAAAEGQAGNGKGGDAR
ncbi:MAG: triose-phosphate isomerase [Alicyclobacillaceae bacterium]|nr:triose-phosphate isomerase [Alicyclobacillaceae bacterium]